MNGVRDPFQRKCLRTPTEGDCARPLLLPPSLSDRISILFSRAAPVRGTAQARTSFLLAVVYGPIL